MILPGILPKGLVEGPNIDAGVVGQLAAAGHVGPPEAKRVRRGLVGHAEGPQSAVVDDRVAVRVAPMQDDRRLWVAETADG